jgi:hypothetical protein
MQALQCHLLIFVLFATLCHDVCVQDTVDDLADYMEDMNEVNEMLGRSYNVGEEVRILAVTIIIFCCALHATYGIRRHAKECAVGALCAAYLRFSIAATASIALMSTAQHRLQMVCHCCLY